MISVPPQCTSAVSPDWLPGANAIVSVKSRALHSLLRLSSLSGCMLCSWNAKACIPLCLHFVHSCTRRAKSPVDWAPLRLSVNRPSLVLPCIACIRRFHCLCVYKKTGFVIVRAGSIHRSGPVFCAMRSSSPWQAEAARCRSRSEAEDTPWTLYLVWCSVVCLTFLLWEQFKSRLRRCDFLFTRILLSICASCFASLHLPGALLVLSTFRRSQRVVCL